MVIYIFLLKVSLSLDILVACYTNFFSFQALILSLMYLLQIFVGGFPKAISSEMVCWAVIFWIFLTHSRFYWPPFLSFQLLNLLPFFQLMEIVSVFGPLKAYRFVSNNDLNQRCAFLEVRRCFYLGLLCGQYFTITPWSSTPIPHLSLPSWCRSCDCFISMIVPFLGSMEICYFRITCRVTVIVTIIPSIYSRP